MKKTWKIFFLLMLLVLINTTIKAQCGSGTPVFTVDLSKNPDSTWYSSSVIRNDTCCSASPCVAFIVTLSADAQAITLDIFSGAMPTGSLFYNVGCSGSTTIGTPLCLSGAGPHLVTFCKPGNNQNIYRIHSIIKPRAGKDIYVRDGCTGTLSVVGLIDSTITWQSLSNNSVYNSYLSCTAGCSSTVVTPKSGRPAYIDYLVCGKPAIGCTGTACDTVRVNFINALKVNISPDTPTICFNSNITLKANVSGGMLPYSFLWNTGDTSQNITVSTGAMYWVQLSDATNCPAAIDTDLVKIFTMPITAYAGNDTVICSSADSAKLNGKIQAAYGGLWSGGTGSFNPGRTTLNAYYKPSASEIAAGKVTLMLHSTGNSSCKPAHDTMNIIISKWPLPAISGVDSVCMNTATISYSTPDLSGDIYNWTATGGAMTSGAGTSAIFVNWGKAGAGMITVTEINAAGCKSQLTKTVKINPRPVPVINGPILVCEYTSANVYAVKAISGDKYQWNITGGSILSGAGTSSVSVRWAYRGTGTISVKETNASGCDTTDSETITIQPKPAPVISGPASVCQNTAEQVYRTKKNTGSTYSWRASGGSISGSAREDTVIVNWGSAGIGTLSVNEINDLGCDTTVKYAITILPKAKPVISGVIASCEKTPASYSTPFISGDTYRWVVDGGTILSGTTSNAIKVFWGNNGPGKITLIETTGAGCDSVIVSNISIYPRPGTFISGPDSSCQNAHQSYTTPNEPGVKYKWVVRGGAIVAGNNTDSIIVFWGTSGPGTILLTETNSFGCDSVISKNVTIYPRPSPAILGDTSVCQNDTGKIYYSTNPVAGNMFNWIVKGGVIRKSANTSTIVVDWHSKGSGIVMLQQTNPSGCDTVLVKNIIIYEKPLPSISGPSITCENVVNIAYSTPNHAGDSYEWNIIGGHILTGAGTNAITALWGSAGLGLISVKETNPSGCDTIIYETITIMPRPVPIITGPGSACSNTVNMYSAALVTGNMYSWKVTGGKIVSGAGTNSIMVKFGSSSSASVSLKETNSFGCDSAMSETIQINPKPAASITGRDTVCKYSREIYFAPMDIPSSYTWKVIGGWYSVGKIPRQIIVDWGDKGIGSIILTKISESGCDTTITKQVTISPLPAPVIGCKDSVCAYETGTLYTVAYEQGNTYAWTVTGGTIMGSASGTAIIINWGTNGTGVVKIKQSNSMGCDTSVQKIVKINSRPAPAIKGFLRVCESRGAYFYTTTAAKGIQYHWVATGGDIIQDAGNSIAVKWGAAGGGTIKLTEINTSGCEKSDSAQISIENHSTTVFMQVSSKCAPALVQFSYPADSNITSNTWDFGDGSVSDNSKTSHLYMNAGDYNIRLITHNSLGCADTAYGLVKIYSNPIAALDIKYSTTEKVLYNNEDYLVLKNTSKYANRYMWDFGDGTVDYNFEPLPHLYILPGRYYLKLYAWNQEDCVDSVIVPLDIETHVRMFIPNAFTPGNSKINTCFSIFTYNVSDFHVLIYNRWGEKLFEARDKNFKWDGTFKGSIVPMDVYIYTIKAKDLLDRDVIRKGTITILR